MKSIITSFLLLAGFTAFGQCSQERVAYETYKATGSLDGWHAYDIAKLVHLHDAYKACKVATLKSTRAFGYTLPVIVNKSFAIRPYHDMFETTVRGGLGFIHIRDGRTLFQVGHVRAHKAYVNPAPVLIKNEIHQRQAWVPIMSGVYLTNDFAITMGMAPSRDKTTVVNSAYDNLVFKQYSIRPCVGLTLHDNKVTLNATYIWGDPSQPFGNQLVLSVGTFIKTK
jgi:hypothetical protein